MIMLVEIIPFMIDLFLAGLILIYIVGGKK